MEDELVRFLLEQSSGVIIALVLILRLEKRMDALGKSLEEIARELGRRLMISCSGC
ncbi:YvrJ family protein [Lacticaseibacillus paracasei]|jgi:hypothetical protein|uniref:YvrJ family protein n=1 Tax=Lacticaseibacillus paracasei TaxID=1597 RepID=UPI001866ACAE|nr:YvrJ family protein [Lacticaseibacillus paracasei]